MMQDAIVLVCWLPGLLVSVTVIQRKIGQRDSEDLMWYLSLSMTQIKMADHVPNYGKSSQIVPLASAQRAVFVKLKMKGQTYSLIWSTCIIAFTPLLSSFELKSVRRAQTAESECTFAHSHCGYAV